MPPPGPGSGIRSRERTTALNYSPCEDFAPIGHAFPHRLDFDKSGLLDQALRRFARAVGAAASFIVSSPRHAGDRTVSAYMRDADPGVTGADRLDEAMIHIDGLDCGEPLFWAGSGDAPILVSRWEESARPACRLILSFDRVLDAGDRKAVEHCVHLFFPLIQLHLKTVEELETVTRSLDGVRGVLDNSEVAIILFSRSGRMLLSNKAAARIVEAQDGLRMGGRGPMPVSLRTAARFQVALEHAIAENGRPARANNGRSSAVMKIPREEGRRPLIAALVPVNETAETPDDPAVILYLFDPDGEHAEFLEAVCQLYDLSKVEGRLARHLATGMTLTEAAEAMRIKDPTARTYLKQIFAKTDTHRQTDLIRLLIRSTGRIITQKPPEAFV